MDEKLYIWDTEKGELLRTLDIPEGRVYDLRISGDGSMVFCLYKGPIQAWSIWTGEVVGKVYVSSYDVLDHSFLTVDGPKVWVQLYAIPAEIVGWDFGISGSPPVKLSYTSRNGPHLNFIGGIREQRSFLPAVLDTVTGKIVFQLPGRLAKPSDAQWDGQYLVAGYDSGEVLILDCNHVLT